MLNLRRGYRVGVPILLTLVAAATLASSSQPISQSTGCGIASPAFCDTFATASTAGGRTGALDPNRWSVARNTGQSNIGQGLANNWIPASVAQCADTVVNGVVPDHDVVQCAEATDKYFVEGFDDNHSYQYDSARVRQPFDFAGRTGTIAWEVDAKTSGSHGWWTEIWITDQPVPAPHAFTDPAYPRNGVGLSFHNTCGLTPPLGTAGAGAAGVGELTVTHNFAPTTLAPWSSPTAGVSLNTPNGCITTQPGVRNLFQLRVNPNHLEVWASDAGATTLKQIAVADGLNLGFTRGYVNFEHPQYNASKAAPGVSDAQSYEWSNTGFDGPILPVPAQYTIPDALAPAGNGSVNLGYVVDVGGLRAGPRTLTGVDLTGATGGQLVFSPWFGAGHNVNYRFNGGTWHTWNGPPLGAGADGTNSRTASASVALADLHAGTNTVDFASIGADQVVVSNIDLVLDGASAGPTATPPANTPTSTPTLSPTSTATNAPTATSTPLPADTPTATPASTPVPPTATPAAQQCVLTASKGGTAIWSVVAPDSACTQP